MEDQLYTLKLDAAWQPIEIIDSFRAFSMVYTGRAKVVENHSQQLNALFYFPSIIICKDYIRKKQVFMSPTRANIYWRDMYRCQYCYKQFNETNLTLDHVIPKSRGGGKSWNNLVTSCSKCNQNKANRTPEEASMKLFKEPVAPRFSVLRARPQIKIPLSWKNYI